MVAVSAFRLVRLFFELAVFIVSLLAGILVQTVCFGGVSGGGGGGVKVVTMSD